MNDLFEVIAAIFLVREHEARERGEHAAAVAYANAFDLLGYAIEERGDCISQFDGYIEANDFIDSSVYGDFWEMEELFKN